MVVVDLWTGRKAGALRTAWRMSIEAYADHLGVATRTVAKWDAEPDIIPVPAMQQVLDTALETAPDAVKARFAILFERHTQEPTREHKHDSREVVMVAANESAEDAALRAAQCPTESISDLHDRTVYVARAYSSRPPMVAFVDARDVRDLARTLVQRTFRPSDLADLYVILGQTNALMGSIAFDLGNWQAAATLARSATTYAELAGHSSLQAWTLGLQGTLAFWRREPEQSLSYLSRGLSIAPHGVPHYRLLYIASRAHAVQGNEQAIGEVLAQARSDFEDRARRPDELNDSIRGEFTFDDARAAACAAAAWLHVGNGEKAASYAEAALNVYTSLPEERRPFSPTTGATIDLAAAYLISGNRDAAEEKLEAALTLPQELRNASLAGRLAKVKDILDNRGHAKEPRSKALSLRIDGWLKDTAARPDVVDEAI